MKHCRICLRVIYLHVQQGKYKFFFGPYVLINYCPELRVTLSAELYPSISFSLRHCAGFAVFFVSFVFAEDRRNPFNQRISYKALKHRPSLTLTEPGSCQLSVTVPLIGLLSAVRHQSLFPSVQP